MRVILPWLPVAALGAFLLAFVVAPTLSLALQSVQGDDGALTLAFLAGLGEYRARVAFENSVLLSAASALVGLAGGGVLAALVLRPHVPAALRRVVTSFSAVASNFAGVPLAFAFIATLGTLGLLTTSLKRIGIDVYAMGFSLFSLSGLTLVYAYFQVPLMMLVIAPALAGLRGEWREAAQNLGATPAQYWRHVGLPVLAPSLLAAFVLLFGNAFAAYATPYALTSGNIGLVPTEISNVLSGNVMESPQAGAALSMGMVAVMGAVLALYLLARRRAARWQR